MNNFLRYKNLAISCIVRSAFWIGLMILIRYQTMFDIAGKDNLWMIFFSIVGVIYAITIAFLLIVVLEKYNKFSATIMDEINLVEDIRDFMIFIKVQPEIQKTIYKCLLKYVDYVCNFEWVKLKEAREKKINYDSDTSSDIYDVMKNITQLEPKSFTGKAAVQEIISKIGDITTIRTVRINLSGVSLSPLLYFYLRLMGSMLTVPFMLFNGGNIFMQGAMIFAVVSAIRILYEIVKDFDNPLTGFWNVQPLALERFIEKEKDKDLDDMFFNTFIIQEEQADVVNSS